MKQSTIQAKQRIMMRAIELLRKAEQKKSRVYEMKCWENEMKTTNKVNSTKKSFCETDN